MINKLFLVFILLVVFFNVGFANSQVSSGSTNSGTCSGTKTYEYSGVGTIGPSFNTNMQALVSQATISCTNNLVADLTAKIHDCRSFCASQNTPTVKCISVPKATKTECLVDPMINPAICVMDPTLGFSCSVKDSSKLNCSCSSHPILT